MTDMDRWPALADQAPDPGHEPPGFDDDFAVYTAASVQWADTWGPEGA
jgi:hypothetical protein